MKLILFALLSSTAVFAGGLRLEITSSKPNTLTTKVVACKSPASSTVSATVLLPSGESRALAVIHKDGSDTFTVEGTGSIPSSGSAVLQLRLANPEFRGYEPRYLVRIENGAPQLSTIQRFDK